MTVVIGESIDRYCVHDADLLQVVSGGVKISNKYKGEANVPEPGRAILVAIRKRLEPRDNSSCSD